MCIRYKKLSSHITFAWPVMFLLRAYNATYPIHNLSDPHHLVLLTVCFVFSHFTTCSATLRALLFAHIYTRIVLCVWRTAISFDGVRYAQLHNIITFNYLLLVIQVNIGWYKAKWRHIVGINNLYSSDPLRSIANLHFISYCLLYNISNIIVSINHRSYRTLLSSTQVVNANN